MNATKFTPGPWAIDPATRPAEVCTIYGLPESETDGQGFAYVRGALGYWEAEEEENMANAHLIAAAPELYEALVEAEKDLVAAQVNARRAAAHDPAWAGVSEAIQPSVDRARAARARARGES